MYEALVTGTRDYVHKNGFTDVVIGLSGGIDSSLVAAIAVDALGPDHVHGVLDAVALLVRPLAVPTPRSWPASSASSYRMIPIEPAHAAFARDAGADASTGLDADLTEENLQSRIRGVVLMALSNKFRAGWC